MTSKLVVNNIGPDAGINTVTVNGAVSATKFIGPVEATTGSFTNDVTISGNLGVAGTITYEDVARVDATGISTFREGFGVGPLTGIALTAYKDGSIRTSGIVTASSFKGDGSALTGVGVGTAGSINTSGIVTATAFVPSQGQLSQRNLIVNGAMTVNQYGGPISAEGYVCDRFNLLYTGTDNAPTLSKHSLS